MLLPSPKFSLDRCHPTKTLLQDSRSASRNLRLSTSIETLNKLHKPLLMSWNACHLLRRNIHHLAYLRKVQLRHPIVVTRRLRRNKASWRLGILQPRPKLFPYHSPMCPCQHLSSVSTPLPRLPPNQWPLILPTQQRMLQRCRQMKPWLDQNLMGRDAVIHLRSPRRSTKSNLRSTLTPINISQMRSPVPHKPRWMSF